MNNNNTELRNIPDFTFLPLALHGLVDPIAQSMDKSSRIVDITASDYEPSPQYINRKVTLYDEEDSGLSILTSVKTNLVTNVNLDGKRTYEEINLADSEEKDTVNIKKIAHRQQADVTLPVRPVVDYSHEIDLLLKNQSERLISIFLALSSTEPQNRLSAFDKMKKMTFPKTQVNLKRLVLSVVEGEMTKKGGITSEPCQLAALQVLKGLDFVKSEVALICLLLLKIITGEAGYVLRYEALITLEGVMKRTANLEIWKSKLIHGFRGIKLDLNELDNFDILPKLFQLDLSVSELVFSVLSFVGANDEYKQVRSLAIELIGKVPRRVRSMILAQSLHKDQIKIKELEKYTRGVESDCEEGEVKEKVNEANNKRIKAAENPSKTSLKVLLPLLCCGVFAHGIEDQFVQIRFKTLKSLFNFMKSDKSDKFALNIFLDSLLDECDLIRLASLKFLRRFSGGLPLTVEGGLESLLAVLDDQNKEIRWEALIIIGDNLILSSSAGAASLNETLLRTQKCLEAALMKYPEMEFQVVRAAFKLVHRHSKIIRKSCLDFWSHLMQCPIPKFMTPTSLLPYSNSCLSSVHAAMQIPFLPEETQQSRLIRIVSRIQDCETEEKLSLLIDTNLEIFNAQMVSNPNLAHSMPAPNNLKLFKLGIPLDNFNNLRCRYEADLLKNAKSSDCFYFFENKIPRAFFKIKRIQIYSKKARDEVRIDEFKLIGSIDHVQLDLIFEEAPMFKGASPSIHRFNPKYGGTVFVAKCPKGTASVTSFKILNCNTRAVVYYHPPN